MTLSLADIVTIFIVLAAKLVVVSAYIVREFNKHNEKLQAAMNELVAVASDNRFAMLKMFEEHVLRNTRLAGFTDKRLDHLFKQITAGVPLNEIQDFTHEEKDRLYKIIDNMNRQRYAEFERVVEQLQKRRAMKAQQKTG